MSYEVTLSPPIFKEAIKLTAKIVLHVRHLAERIRHCFKILINVTKSISKSV